MLIYCDLFGEKLIFEVVARSTVRDCRKVASSSMSQLVAHFHIFRRLMKGKFDVYVL